MIDKKLTAKESAKILGCTVQHIRLLIRKELLDAEKLPSKNNQYGFEYLIPKESVVKYKKLNFSRGCPRGVKRKSKRKEGR